MLVFLIININKNSNNKILIIETNKEKFYYSLSNNQIVEIKGILGITKIKIENNKFCFIDSPCQNKDCINMGYISITNYPVICLPNQVSAYIITQDNNNQYDGITR